MKHFFALELSPEARQAVAALVDDWKCLLLPFQYATWYNPDDYHITLKFLGDLPEMAQLQLTTAATPVAEVTAPFQISLAGTGMFPNNHHPKVLWAGVALAPPLSALAATLDTALSAEGFAPEQRPYNPHITVARCRFALEGEPWLVPTAHTFAEWKVARLVLMQTLPQQKRAIGPKPRYTIVHTFPFGNPHSSTH